MSNLNELIVDVTATVVSPTEFQAKADVEISNQFSATASADLVVKIEGGDDIQIPTVTNIKVDEYGLLTFDEPDFSKLEKFNPIISYLITVNGTQFESTTNSISILSMLVDGDNVIDVKTKALLTTYSENVEEVVEFSVPEYTDASLFTYSKRTIDGVEGYVVTGYTGTEDYISIPEYNTDGIPILGLSPTINISNIKGLFIKHLDCVSNNPKTKIINFPSLKMTSMNSLFDFWRDLEIIEELNTTGVQSTDSMFRGCSKLKIIPLFDMSQVKHMSIMFMYNSSLEEIPLFDTSNVLTMSNCFYSCINLKKNSCIKFNQMLSISVCI